MNIKKIILLIILCFGMYKFVGIEGIILLVLIYFIFFFVYKKKYYIKLITGETGAGKTLLANHFVQQFIKKGNKNVYTTFYCEGANKLPTNFYEYNYPKDSVLIIDESQIGLDSREFNKLVKTGASNKLLAMLSMHRHNKLHIYFITQNAEEVDVRIRRYCNEFIMIKKLIFFRRFSIKFKKLKFNTFICPLIIKYESWKSYKDYERWYNNSAEFSPKEYGAINKYSITLKRDYDTYSTYQEDSYYHSLKNIISVFWKDQNEFLDTGTS